MREHTRKFIDKYRTDFGFKTVSGAVVSFIVTVVFALYNGYLGLKYGSRWNGFICVYYIILTVIRGILLSYEMITRGERRSSEKTVHTVTSVMLFVSSLSLAYPIYIMYTNEKNVSMTLIPALATACYTTYKVVMACMNFKKILKTDDPVIGELKNITFIDAVLSLLTLQNTLLCVQNSINDENMKTLAMWTSIGGMVVIIAICIFNVIKFHGKHKFNRVS